jgi:Protein of unknown function (DUF3237)
MQPQFEFVMTVHLRLAPHPIQKIGPLPTGGDRLFVPLADGVFEGPRLRGKVLPGGAEVPLISPEGVLRIDARYCLQEDDGTVILLRNRGIRRAPPEVFARWRDPAVKEKPAAAEFYMRVVPTFEAPQGKHAWLTENIFFGILADQPSPEPWRLSIDYHRLL